MRWYLQWGSSLGREAATSRDDTWRHGSCCWCGIRARRRNGCCSSGGNLDMGMARSGSLHARAPEGECSCLVGLEKEREKTKRTWWKQSWQGLFPPHTQVNYYNYSSLSLASTSCCCLRLMPDFFLPTPPSFSAALQQHQVVFLQLSRNRKYSGGGVSCGAASQCRPVKPAGLFLAFLQYYSLVKAQTFKQRFREMLKFWAIN